jgi:hypothetical protein
MLFSLFLVSLPKAIPDIPLVTSAAVGTSVAVVIFYLNVLAVACVSALASLLLLASLLVLLVSLCSTCQREKV